MEQEAAADLGRVHLLPCGIRQNGAAPISDYFKPKDTGVEVEGMRVEEAFFRGRRLQGATIALPDGYQGYILENDWRKGYAELGGGWQF